MNITANSVVRCLLVGPHYSIFFIHFAGQYSKINAWINAKEGTAVGIIHFVQGSFFMPVISARNNN